MTKSDAGPAGVHARTRAAAVSAATIMLMVLPGCSDDTGGGGQGGAGPAAQDCAKAADITPPATAGTTTLVVDNTASGVRGPVPPAITTELTAAQARGDRLAIVPVNGAGTTPRISRSIALDPYPGKNSRSAQNARAAVLACVATWMHEKLAQPTAPGSDILAALSTASMEQPRTLLVVSDGLATGGEVDVNRDGFDGDPDQAAAQLAASQALAPTLRGRRVVWAGLARARVAVRPSLATSLQQLWSAVLRKAGARATFDPRAGDSTVDAPVPDLPADPVTIPDAVRRATACGAEVTVPAALLFTPGSARLQPGTEDLLRQVAADLLARPAWAATVTGHTAEYGAVAARLTLSRQRAEAVVTALTGLQVPASRLTAAGVGSREPAVPEFTGGRHDEAAAAKNRRVVIEMGAKGCGS